MRIVLIMEKMLLNDAGLPQGDSKIQKIGDQQATCLVGWTNTFSYKNFTLSFLVDARIGGEIFLVQTECCKPMVWQHVLW